VREPYPTKSQFSWTLWGLRAQIALAVPLIVLRLSEMVLLPGVGKAIRDGGDPDVGLLTTLDNVIQALTLLNLLALVVSAVAFLIWWHHSVANFRAAGQPISVTPEWATAMWFVPFANLVLPLSVMKELAGAAQDTRRASRTSLWWAAWIIGNVVSYVATNSVRKMGADPILQTTIAEGLYVFSKVMLIVAAVQLMALMRFVQQRNDDLPGQLLTDLSPVAPNLLGSKIP
jgi:Domain of unknown function (DUF4328)